MHKHPDANPRPSAHIRGITSGTTGAQSHTGKPWPGGFRWVAHPLALLAIVATILAACSSEPFPGAVTLPQGPGGGSGSAADAGAPSPPLTTEIPARETAVHAPDASTVASTPTLTPTFTLTPTPTPTSTFTPAPTFTPASTPTLTPAPTTPPSTPTPHTEGARRKVTVNGRVYDAYIPAATKKKQEYHYSCEFDAAWVVLKTYGFDVSVDQQAAIVGVDTSIEPYFKETRQGIFIYGGDVTNHYSGDYKTNFLARSTGAAMRKVFEHFGLKVTPVHDREGIEAALLRGELVWIKTTVDFKGYRPATWVMPDGRTYQTVLGNDHAVVVMGFNQDVVVIRDVLGPTNTNWNRVYEYEVTWPVFMKAWGAQSYDGLAVGK